MLHQLKRAIDPGLPLLTSLKTWTGICKGLAEAPRKRRPRGLPSNTDVN
jgi:hypothetical protein